MCPLSGPLVVSSHDGVLVCRSAGVGKAKCDAEMQSRDEPKENFPLLLLATQLVLLTIF